MSEKTELKPSFLVVDDEPAVGRLLKRALAPLTDDIVVVESAAEALQVCLGRSFDLVVRDMRMPGMDGAKMLRRIKDSHPEIMTILLTGHADFEFGGSQALQSGFLFKILIKPCPPQQLSAAIKLAIEAKDENNEENEKAPDTVL